MNKAKRQPQTSIGWSVSMSMVSVCKHCRFDSYTTPIDLDQNTSIRSNGKKRRKNENKMVFTLF